VLMIPIWGFASAANSMVSYLIGMRKQDFVFLLIKRIVLMAMASVGLLVLLSQAVPEAILRIYTNDPDLILNSIPVLKVVSLSSIFLASGFVFFNGVMGTGKTNVSFLIELLVLLIYIAYVYVLINFFGANVTMAWTSEIVYGLLLTSFSWLYC
jgi:multidrug resistance protein, MATE family